MSTTFTENKRGNKKVKTSQPLCIELRYINGKTLPKFSTMYTYIRLCVQMVSEMVIYKIFKIYL